MARSSPLTVRQSPCRETRQSFRSHGKWLRSKEHRFKDPRNPSYQGRDLTRRTWNTSLAALIKPALWSMLRPRSGVGVELEWYDFNMLTGFCVSACSPEVCWRVICSVYYVFDQGSRERGGSTWTEG